MLLRIMVVLAAMVLSGCYRTVAEVILPGDSAAVPSLSGTYRTDYNHMAADPFEKDLIRFARTGTGNDFSVVISDDDDSGSVRFRRLRDEFYVAQMASGPMSFGSDGYDISFVRITPKTFDLLLAVPPGYPMPDDGERVAFERWFDSAQQAGAIEVATQRAATPFGVTVQDRDGRITMDGKAVDIRRFIAAHRDWQFVAVARFTKLNGK